VLGKFTVVLPADDKEKADLRTVVAPGLVCRCRSWTPQRAGTTLPSSNHLISFLYGTKRWFLSRPASLTGLLHLIHYFVAHHGLQVFSLDFVEFAEEDEVDFSWVKK
jgi:hypothetical protein